jgi:hypothetical protein
MMPSYYFIKNTTARAFFYQILNEQQYKLKKYLPLPIYWKTIVKHQFNEQSKMFCQK